MIIKDKLIKIIINLKNIILLINIKRLELIINNIEEMDWIIKYFITNSLKNLLIKIINGIYDIRFNSIEIQIENQELKDIEINGEIKKIGKI